jgi:hypothetical protein
VVVTLVHELLQPSQLLVGFGGFVADEHVRDRSPGAELEGLNGSTFLGWSGGSCTGTQPTCTVTMDRARFVSADFRGPIFGP